MAESALPARGPIRVLVVDDSAFMRLTLTRHLEEAPGLAVVGAAHDGEEALRMIPDLNPDVITLDVEMPRLDGLSTLREIMDRFPRPVVMLSSLTAEGASETVQALTLGAVDFIQKPDTKANIGAILPDVLAKIRHAADAKVRRIAMGTAPPPAPKENRDAKDVRPLRQGDRVVMLGASTGGPFALSTVVAGLPADLPAALIIVQHMPAGFTRSLADRLDNLCPLAIKEAAEGDRLETGKGLLAPGGFHMRVDERGTISLDRGPTLHGVRPAVDVTMATVAQHFGRTTVAAVLTGMGRDGTQGCQLIHAAGGKVVAEHESTCVVWGMPRSVTEAGVADRVAPLPSVAAAIVELIR